MLSHNFTYESALADSLKVQWKVEDIIGDDKALDFSKPFLPDSLAGVNSIRCLNDNEKLILNHIRGNSYLYLFGFVEEFILPFILEQAQKAVHGDLQEIRALVTFAEEEAKHMHLFQRFSEEFRKGFETPCKGIGPAKDVAAAILNHGALGISLAILHIEWMTQKHYLDSVKGSDAGAIDPQFASLLRHHWMEEAQHAKIDTMITDKLASAATPEEIEAAFRDYGAIGAILDGGLRAQVNLDLEALAQATKRTFTTEEKAEITAAQTQSYRFTFLVSGMTHPNFIKALSEISPSGQKAVAEMAKSLS